MATGSSPSAHRIAVSIRRRVPIHEVGPVCMISGIYTAKPGLDKHLSSDGRADRIELSCRYATDITHKLSRMYAESMSAARKRGIAMSRRISFGFYCLVSFVANWY